MLNPGAKRFFKTVDFRAEGNGFAVLLDGKPVKTPAAHVFIAPTRALAEAIAEEWRGQGERIAPETMPLTKTLNSALDHVAAHRSAIIDDLAKYAATDLLSYRAVDPEELVRRQSAVWDQWLAWAAERYGAPLKVVTGMTHVEQPRESLAKLWQAIADHDDFRLVALHPAITITGSAVLGLALTAKVLSADDAFAAAQVDEDYQTEHWGRDAEAEAVRARRLSDLRAARRFIDLLD